MISKRGLVAAGALGLGTVLLAGTGAYACVIGDFSADSAVACDTSSSAPQGVVTVHNDDSLTGATVTVFQQGSQTQLGQGHIDQAPGRGEKSTLTIPVPWQSGASYTVHIHSDKFNLDKDVPSTPQAPNTECSKPVTPSAPATPPSKPTPPVTKPTSTPSSTPSTDATSTPAPAPSQSSAGTTLAETGGGSSSTTMIGIAAALVVVGGGALFLVRRKAGARG